MCRRPTFGILLSVTKILLSEIRLRSGAQAAVAL